MEVEFDADWVASDEESAGTLVRRNSKRNSARNLKGNEANETVKPETETERNATIVNNIEGVIIKVQNGEEKFSGDGFETPNLEIAENAGLSIVWHENKDFISAGSDDDLYSNDPVVMVTADLTHPKAPLQPSVYYADEQGSEINAILDRGSESIDYESKETESVLSEMVIQTMADMEKNQNWPTAKGKWQSNYMDSETSTDVTQSFVTGKFNHKEKTGKGKGAYLDTPAFSEIGSIATGRNGEDTNNEAQEKTENRGVKEHKHGNSGFEIILQNSQDRYVRAQDEQQLKEHWTRILEKNALEGKVEDIVNILKEQQSHDLICPICKSCITKRVILRKRKRTRLVSDDRWHQEASDDVQGAVSDEEDKITEDQRDRSAIFNEDDERTEAYGCLACFSLFFRRGVNNFTTKSESGNNSLADKYPCERRQDSRMLVDKEKDSFYCLPFLYPWGHSVNKESNKPGAKTEYAVGTSQKKSGKEAESISKIIPSKSNLGIADTLQLNEAVSEVPTTTIVTGNILMNDGKKATTVNKVGLNVDDTDAENGKLDSQLNLGAVYDKDHVAGEKFTRGLPNRTAGHPDTTIQNIWSQTSTTTKSTQIYSRSTENAEIRETNYTATETTKSTQYLNEDSEFPQLEKHYLRLPNVEMSEGQLTMPASNSKPTVDGQTGQTQTKCEVPNESVPVKESDMQGQHLDKPDESKNSEKQHPYQKDVKGTGDKLTELHFNGSAALSEEQRQVKTEQVGVYASTKHVDMFQIEETTMNKDMIRRHLDKQEQASNDLSAAARDEDSSRSEQQSDNMKEDMAVRQGQSEKDYPCSCIPVSIPAVWSIWSSKESIADQQLKEPFLANIKDKKTFDKKVPAVLKDDQQRELLSPLKLDSVEPSSSFETRDPAFLAKSKVNDSVSQSSEISPDSGKIVTLTDGMVATVIDIEQMHDPQPSNAGTAVPELKKKSSAQVRVPNVVRDWDILKSIVYGGLTVSITSLGVVSSAAGGEAKTLTVIAIGLSNLIAGLFLIFNNILYLDHFHQNEFKETVGDRFWFNGFVAILSYLIFGSLAPITYGFSFQKSDNRVYKFLATSLVSLLSIILLSLGKARVTKKSYIRIVIMYIVTGFWASIIGFFAGEYIKKLLEKWGFTTD